MVIQHPTLRLVSDGGAGMPWLIALVRHRCYWTARTWEDPMTLPDQPTFWPEIVWGDETAELALEAMQNYLIIMRGCGRDHDTSMAHMDACRGQLRRSAASREEARRFTQAWLAKQGYVTGQGSRDDEDEKR